MSDHTLVFKAGGGGGGGIFAVGFSVGMVIIKLTRNKNLTCKVMMLGAGTGGEAVLLGIGAVHAWFDALSFSFFNLDINWQF